MQMTVYKQFLYRTQTSFFSKQSLRIEYYQDTYNPVQILNGVQQLSSYSFIFCLYVLVLINQYDILKRVIIQIKQQWEVIQQQIIYSDDRCRYKLLFFKPSVISIFLNFILYFALSSFLKFSHLLAKIDYFC
ncbi:unnamed protein product [Paramecium pentaurelia]|uniref:Transmembrane protein n=1 Tax=Paramecium pentaurelia TaxID=43138 RepID=A0A8S1Y060_9CILI|nr:unnamed protein product [Paramecium pentaurelia]